MPMVWGLTESKEYWALFFSDTHPTDRRKPLLWTCQPVSHVEQLLREQARIYDPFVGFALPQAVVTCLGVLNSRGYVTTEGFTIELLPLEPIPNPIPMAALLAAEALPPEAARELGNCRVLSPLEISHWTNLKNIITDTNPLLTSSLTMVENWHQRQRHLERILDILAQRGCSEDAEQELFVILRTLTLENPNNDVPSGHLALQTRLRVALKAQLLPAKQWEALCKGIVDAWYGYVMTLTPQEVTQLTDLNQDFSL